MPLNQKNIFQTINQSIPASFSKSINIIVDADSYTLIYRWFTKPLLISFLLVFSMSLFTIIHNIYRNIISGVQLNLLGVICGIVIIGLINYPLLGRCINSSSFKLTSTHLIVHHHPLPWNYNHKFLIKEIAKINIIKEINAYKNALYKIKVSLNNGQQYTICGNIRDHQLPFFIVEQIQQGINLVKNIS